MKQRSKSIIIFVMLIVAALSLVPVMAQDDVALSENSDAFYGITSLIPDGWEEIAPGIVGRMRHANDRTVLVRQAAPLSQDQILSTLMTQLQQTETPEAVATHESDALSWTLYQLDISAGDIMVIVDLGLANSEGVTYIVLLQTSPDEYESLHDAVFVPVIDSLAPIADEPTADITYLEEDVTFSNGDITLAGMLTLPDSDGPHPAVILVTGSGGQDRDESLVPLAAMKPFALIADHLTRNGIAVLRYDDRGVGLSTGNFDTATSADFASDAVAAFDFLLTRDAINSTQIGLLGHSEGGAIAPMVAVERPQLAFVISMAGTAVDGADVLRVQNRRILAAEGATDAQIEGVLSRLDPLFDAVTNGDNPLLENRLRDLIDYQIRTFTPADELPDDETLESMVEAGLTQQLTLFESPWYPYFLTYNPAEFWSQVDVPVLALFGGLDVQVDAEQNRSAMEIALEAAGNTDATFVTIPTANHLFQDAVSGSPSEYNDLEQTFHPDFLPTITEWLLARVDVVA